MTIALACAATSGAHRGGSLVQSTLCRRRETAPLAKTFKVGDHVSWNSEAGYGSGRIVKVHTKNVNYLPKPSEQCVGAFVRMQ
jgi:hypothetical protein